MSTQIISLTPPPHRECGVSGICSNCGSSSVTSSYHSHIDVNVTSIALFKCGSCQASTMVAASDPVRENPPVEDQWNNLFRSHKNHKTYSLTGDRGTEHRA